MSKTEKTITKIDIYSSQAKREAGILWYNPPFHRNPSVWTKTPKEKAALKRAKRNCTYKFSSSWV